MGLLDQFDPGALSLLAAAGPTSQPMSLGQRLFGAMQQQQAMRQADEDRRLKQQMQALQMQLMNAQVGETKAQADERKQRMDDMRRARELEDQFRNLIPSPQLQATQQALSGGGGPTISNAARMPAVDPTQQLLFDAMRLGQMKPTDYMAGMRKDTTPIKLGAGDTLVQPGTFKPLYTAPNKPTDASTSAIKDYEYAKAQGYPGTFQQFQLEQRKAGASNVSVSTGQKGFDNTLKLRGDFRSEPVYKAHQEMQSAYSQISQALKQASPAGDLAGATKLMKLLDPGSVVRESELGMAMAASGLMDRLQNYATNVMSGTKLTPTQRADFQRLSDALYAESVKQYNNKRSEYQGIAERNGLSVPDVLGGASVAPNVPGQWSIKRVP